MGMDSAQVTAGGSAPRNLTPLHWKAACAPGYTPAASFLDIDGDCGGYNLQWAWSSGYAAGTAAGKDTP